MAFLLLSIPLATICPAIPKLSAAWRAKPPGKKPAASCAELLATAAGIASGVLIKSLTVPAISPPAPFAKLRAALKYSPLSLLAAASA